MLVVSDCLWRDKIGKDDYIGTTYINLSEISASGENGKDYL